MWYFTESSRINLVLVLSCPLNRIIATFSTKKNIVKTGDESIQYFRISGFFSFLSEFSINSKKNKISKKIFFLVFIYFCYFWKRKIIFLLLFLFFLEVAFVVALFHFWFLCRGVGVFVVLFFFGGGVFFFLLFCFLLYFIYSLFFGARFFAFFFFCYLVGLCFCIILFFFISFFCGVLLFFAGFFFFDFWSFVFRFCVFFSLFSFVLLFRYFSSFDFVSWVCFWGFFLQLFIFNFCCFLFKPSDRRSPVVSEPCKLKKRLSAILQFASHFSSQPILTRQLSHQLDHGNFPVECIQI